MLEMIRRNRTSNADRPFVSLVGICLAAFVPGSAFGQANGSGNEIGPANYAYRGPRGFFYPTFPL